MSTFQNTWHHIRRSPFQSLTALFVMSSFFFLISSFLIISNGLSAVLKHFETKPEITIFLKDGLDKDTLENLKKELSNYPSIKEIKYISKEKALSLYKEQNKDNPMLTEMVTSSILPASFEVSVSDPKTLDQIATNFSNKSSSVDEIIYQKDIIESLIAWTATIRKSGLILVSTVSLVTFLVTFVIIGMKATNRKEEIKVSRLLGASKFYVKKPFLMEGVFYGIVGGLFGSLLSIGIFYYFRSSINQFFNPIIFIPSDYSLFMAVVGISVVAGIFIGYISSYLSVRRYIKF